MRNIMTLITTVFALSLFTGCQSMGGFTPAQRGAIYGGGAGAAAGQILGGNTESTLIGAGAGALGGALINDHVDNQKRRSYEQGRYDGQNNGRQYQQQSTPPQGGRRQLNHNSTNQQPADPDGRQYQQQSASPQQGRRQQNHNPANGYGEQRPSSYQGGRQVSSGYGGNRPPNPIGQISGYQNPPNTGNTYTSFHGNSYNVDANMAYNGQGVYSPQGARLAEQASRISMKQQELDHRQAMDRGHLQMDEVRQYGRTFQDVSRSLRYLGR